MVDVLYIINGDNAIYRRGKDFIVYDNKQGTLSNERACKNLQSALINCKTTMLNTKNLLGGKQ